MTDRILIGKVVGVHGLAGNIKVYDYAQAKDRYDRLDNVFVGDREFRIEKVRHKANLVILKLEGVESRGEAENLRNMNVEMAESDLDTLPKDEFYIKDLIGMNVLQNEENIGILKDVLTDRPQDIYVVEMPDDHELMIPAVEHFVRGVDIISGIIQVENIEELK